MAKPEPQERSFWNFELLKVSGIPIRLHITFILMLVWILFGMGSNALVTLGFILALFVCVALHELGHALAARHYGIETISITIYPIGGLAIIENVPKASAEIWIALAGPLVNFVIAFFLALGQVLRTGKLPGFEIGASGVSFLQAMFAANVALAVFNLIPAFPMDGGRILRALVSLKTDEPRATSIAVGIGQALAVLLFFMGFMERNWVLVLVAALVFIAASQELAAVTTHTLMSGGKARDAMLSEVTSVKSGETMNEAARHLLHGSQHDFPVMVGEEVVGVLTHEQILHALKLGQGDEYVAAHMARNNPFCGPEDDLELVSQNFQSGPQLPVIVNDDQQRLVGMITKESLGEFLMVRSAKVPKARG